ncbi:MAG: hypothetical protein Fur0032_23820 [Terrimicrobiaceae bacterium]
MPGRVKFVAALTVILSGTCSIYAQEINASDTGTKAAPTRILDSQEVDHGDRKITYNRIETPPIKPQPLPEAAAEAAKEHVPTAEVHHGCVGM